MISLFLQIDIWKFADKHVKISGRDGRKYDLSLACGDIIAHEKLTDEVCDPILIFCYYDKKLNILLTYH